MGILFFYLWFFLLAKGNTKQSYATTLVNKTKILTDSNWNLQGKWLFYIKQKREFYFVLFHFPKVLSFFSHIYAHIFSESSYIFCKKVESRSDRVKIRMRPYSIQNQGEKALNFDCYITDVESWNNGLQHFLAFDEYVLQIEMS